MREDSFFAQVLRAVVAQQKKKVRENPPDYFLNQKKQLWYGLMNAVDAPETPWEEEAQSSPQE